jgi:hypothetical protein
MTGMSTSPFRVDRHERGDRLDATWAVEDDMIAVA